MQLMLSLLIWHIMLFVISMYNPITSLISWYAISYNIVHAMLYNICVHKSVHSTSHVWHAQCYALVSVHGEFHYKKEEKENTEMSINSSSGEEQGQLPTQPALTTPTFSSLSSRSNGRSKGTSSAGNSSSAAPIRLLRLYLYYLDKHPVATKAVTRCPLCI